jgi:hypothetical protein
MLYLSQIAQKLEHSRLQFPAFKSRQNRIALSFIY